MTVRATVADGLASPWGLLVLPDGDLLVSERDTAQILRIAAKDGTRTVAGTVPGVVPGGEGGLLGIALSPDYATDHLVYTYFSTAGDNRIARLPYDPAQPATQQLGSVEVLLTGIPHGPRHNGGRIAFGPDGLLYAGTGDSSNSALAQDKASLAGKILRLAPDGTPAPGNPFPGSPVYTYGHRNVQGLAWDPQGRLWASEFGQDNWDELNLIRAGGNYGWPVVEESAAAPGTSTRWSSGAPPRPPRAASPTPTAASGWPRCAAPGSGASRSTATTPPGPRRSSSPTPTAGCAPSSPTGTALCC